MKQDKLRNKVGVLVLSLFVSTGLLACFSSGDDPISVAANKFLCALFFGLGGDNDVGIAGGTDGRLARTTDGGLSWTPVTTGITYGVKDFAFESGGLVGVGVGGDGSVIRTTDGGINWANMPMVGVNNLNAVAGSGTNYWAVGDAGSIYASSDSGQTWVHQTSGTTENLNGVCFFNQNLGWAVGDMGTVVGTTNGSDWTTYNTPVSLKLRGCFTDGLNFSLAWGDSGTLIESNNFSTFNAPINTGTTQDLYDFKLKPSLSLGFTGTGLMVGNNVILKTLDFGNNWSTVHDDTSAGEPFTLKKLIFSPLGVANAVGVNDAYYQSNDNGDSWTANLALRATF